MSGFAKTANGGAKALAASRGSPPLSFLLSLTYSAVHGEHILPYGIDLPVLAGFCVLLFAASLWNIRRKWIM